MNAYLLNYKTQQNLYVDGGRFVTTSVSLKPMAKRYRSLNNVVNGIFFTSNSSGKISTRPFSLSAPIFVWSPCLMSWTTSSFVILNCFSTMFTFKLRSLSNRFVCRQHYYYYFLLFICHKTHIIMKYTCKNYKNRQDHKAFKYTLAWCRVGWFIHKLDLVGLAWVGSDYAEWVHEFG